jgi:hypothetical protein
VTTVEGELLRWLDGFGDGNVFAREHGVGQPRIIDATPSSFEEAEAHAKSTSAPVAPTSAPHLPTAAQPTPFSTNSSTSSEALSTLLHSFYNSSSLAGSSQKAKTRPALVELMRAPHHLIWAVADSFERLVVHLLCRYYELSSFSTLYSLSTWSEQILMPERLAVQVKHCQVARLAIRLALRTASPTSSYQNA